MNQPILQFIENKNYKNLSLPHPVELDNLNIFIGSNGSGKSNFISCLKFLKDCLTTIPDESRGVSSFEDAVTKIGADRILDNRVESPAVINFRCCFSQKSQNDTQPEKSTMLTINLFVDRDKHKVIISQEFLFSGQSLSKSESQPFYYYKFHDQEVGKGVVSVYDSSRQNSTSRFERLNNIPTNSLGLSILPSLLEYSHYSPENTPAYQIRRDLVEFIAKWQFYNANNMDLNQIRTSEPKIGGSDIYLSASGDNLPLVLDNLIQENIDFEDSINQAIM